MSKELEIHVGDAIDYQRGDHEPAVVQSIQADRIRVSVSVNGTTSIKLGDYFEDQASIHNGGWQLVWVDAALQQARAVYRSVRYLAAERTAMFIENNGITEPVGGQLLEVFRVLGGKTIEPGGRSDYDVAEEPTVIGKIYDNCDMFWFRKKQDNEADLEDLAFVLAFYIVVFPQDYDYLPGRFDVDLENPRWADILPAILASAAMLLAAAEGVRSDLATQAFASLEKVKREWMW